MFAFLQVDTTILVEIARRGEDQLRSFLKDFVPGLSGGAVGDIMVFFYPIGGGGAGGSRRV